MSKSQTFSDITLLAVEAALKAGEILRNGFGTTYSITEKTGKHDVVTEYDHAAEKCIISIIKNSFPNDAILAEETGYSPNAKDSKLTWLIDPLDGTSNFSHQIPLFVVSIAAYHFQEPMSAVVFQPITRELFIAEKGRGSFLNNEKLNISSKAHLPESMIAIGLPYNRALLMEQGLHHFTQFVHEGAALRNFGTGALSLAYVAAGKLDAAWFSELSPWDVAAGKLLIEEAGGCVTDSSGASFNIMNSSSLLAGNPLLHSNIVKQFQNKAG